MTPANIAITILIGLIVVLVLLFWFLIKHFAFMKPKEREMYGQEMSKEFNDELAQKALDEIELREKLMEVMK